MTVKSSISLTDEQHNFAKELVEAVPQSVKECVSTEEAGEMKKKLEAAGGCVCIK